ncbi:cobalt ECF transporter T component CbiQ [Pseudooceanicola sp.]|uniref:cobalt ECF transporter T component CbiQ n=1 Tax=Pseudooceanicola sp. TaxID=1914328 RepID=UPI0035C67956
MAHVLGHREKTLAQAGTVARQGAITPLDPRMRIVMACVFGCVTVALSTLPALVAAFAIALSLLAMSRLPWRQTLKRMAMMDAFIIFMLILLPFSMPGDPIFTLWGFPASWQGLWKAVEIALTANAVILALMVLVGTMEPVALGHALHRLRCPETLVHLLMFTIRYIEVLREEYLRLRAAMKVRGFRPGTNWHTYRSFGYLVGMMLVRAIERSERILGAMKCRGFSGRMLLLQDYALTRRDITFALGLTGLCLGLIWLDIAWR